MEPGLGHPQALQPREMSKANPKIQNKLEITTLWFLFKEFFIPSSSRTGFEIAAPGLETTWTEPSRTTDLEHQICKIFG